MKNVRDCLVKVHSEKKKLGNTSNRYKMHLKISEDCGFVGNQSFSLQDTRFKYGIRRLGKDLAIFDNEKNGINL